MTRRNRVRPAPLVTHRDDGWRLVESADAAAHPGALESLFAVGNGYLGVRGALEEGAAAHDPGIVLNGFHETWPIEYPEDAYGLARLGQTAVTPPDGSVLRLEVDGEAPRLARSTRELDLRRGVLRREAEWATAGGGRLRVRSERLASLHDRHLAAMHFELTALDAPLRVTISSELRPARGATASDDPRRGRDRGAEALDPLAAETGYGRAVLRLATRSSGLELACGMAHEVTGDAPVRVDTQLREAGAVVTIAAELAPGQVLRLEKALAYHWGPAGAAGLGGAVHGTLDRATGRGYARVARMHADRVAAFWRRADVEVHGAPDVQAAVRFNLFGLLQATAGTDGLGVPAKGVTGRGYEGHYFWDTEIYVVPALVHLMPERARALLEARCEMLPEARRRARELGHRGALFPWRTINGADASAWYAAGTAQYHINADVAYALHVYGRVTGDLAFLLDRGAETLVETARFWLSLGFFSPRRGGRFCLHAVTGPDEYTTVVDDNAYTNLMARENLEVAVRVVEWLRAGDPAGLERLREATGLEDGEVEAWGRAAALVHVPRDAELGIVLQDDGFLDREPWDFDATPREHHPLLLHHHPLELYRRQVIKQTDVVLATYLVGHHFGEDEVRRTFDYYDPLTTGDSSLSACVQSIVASQVGHADLALEYFLDACEVDLTDSHGNTADGLHVASCGGTWLALVAGFGGLRDADGDVGFAPHLPAQWSRLRFRIEVRGQVVEVDLTHAATTYRLLDGRGLMLSHLGEAFSLRPGVPVVRPAIPAPALPADLQEAA
jgi:alpha,alpha-trehalose phosphorylase